MRMRMRMRIPNEKKTRMKQEKSAHSKGNKRVVVKRGGER
jgi:hypothetical protein